MSNYELPLSGKPFPNQFLMSDFSPILLGVTGYAGSGKDTVANMLREKLLLRVIPRPSMVTRESYARPIKEAYLAKWGTVLNFTYEDMDDFEWKKQRNPFTGTTHRQELQFDGTEGTRVRTNNPDVWVQHLWARNRLKNGVLVVSDTRFGNEVNFTSQHGVLIKVNRPGQETISTSSHESEVICPDGASNFVVINDGSKEDLRAKVQSLVDTVFSSDFKDLFRGVSTTSEIQKEAKEIVLSGRPRYFQEV